MNRTILIPGGAGYVGSRLVPLLLEIGYKVIVYDTFWYGKEIFKDLDNCSNLTLIEGDIRDYVKLEKFAKNATDVIHLACISNDPSCDLNPKITEEINLTSFRPFLEICKKSSISRFIFASSSSVYGVKEEIEVTENLTLNPLTDYAKYKSECENILLEYTSSDFVTTIVRPGTISGFAKRQRLDLIVNIFAYSAFSSSRLIVEGGNQSRPTLHIQDMCEAYICLLSQENTLINGKTFNIGSTNLTVTEIAEKVNKVFNSNLEIDYTSTFDNRSYRISSQLIKDTLNFSAKYSLEDSVLELRSAFENKYFKIPLNSPVYRNVLMMKKLLN